MSGQREGRRPGGSVRVEIDVVEDGRTTRRSDRVVTEEPMEIRLNAGGESRTVAVTMRTPGNDFELAAGFLYAEGIVTGKADVPSIRYCVDPDVEGDQRYNIVTVDLASHVQPDLRGLERHVFTSSACGVCGKTSLDALKVRGCAPAPKGSVIDASVITALPERLRDAQGIFDATGGLHAAGLFDATGELVAVREDVGRHNALDKLVGWALMDGRLPLHDHILLVSGRASYELVQKALVAGIGVVCAVSAPSSLAVAVAEEFEMTLIGFMREDRFNVYTGAPRIMLPTTTPTVGG